MQNVNNLTEILTKSFEVVQGFEGIQGRGCRVLVVTGALLRSADGEEVLRQIRAALPADACLMEGADGALFRTGGYYVADQVQLLFLSTEWPELSEGDVIPRLQPIFLYTPPAPLDAPLPYIHSLKVSNLMEVCEIAIDRNTHHFIVPADRETKDQVVLVVVKNGLIVGDK